MNTQADDFNRRNRIIDVVPGLRRSGAYHIGPCPFCGGRDRFNVKSLDDGDLWICRQCGDGKYHDAVAFFMRRDGRSFAELVGRSATGGRTASSGRTATGATPHPAMPDPAAPDLAMPPPDDWQIPAIVAACESANTLRGDTAEAATARHYLDTHRKLTAWSLDTFTIGFNPARRWIEGCGWLEPGITIPGMVDGELWYLQVRTTAAARAAAAAEGRRLGKYSCLAGSKLGALFNADRLLGAETAFVVEGEFDAMVLTQYCPWPEVCAVTMGSASSLPPVTWLRYFAPVRDVALLLDNDDAGRAALDRWRQKLPRARVARLPDGSKDVTDFRRAGGNLVEWVYENWGSRVAAAA